MIPLVRPSVLSLGAMLLCVPAFCQPAIHGPAPRNMPLTGQTGKTGSANGSRTYQGDIILDKAARSARGANVNPSSLTIASTQDLWPQVGGVATVYYVIDPASDPSATPNINAAIAASNADFPGLLQWVPWQSGDGPNYVDINLSSTDFSGQCEAAEGYEAVPAQPMAGSALCSVTTILHEMGHVIGLWHEQSRPDRDNYIAVNYNNVIKGSWSNYDLLTQNAQILGLYDYASVMQYPPYSFSRNGGPVIETVPAGIPLQNTEGVPVPAKADYSAGDKETIERLYGAPPTHVTVTSNPVGLQVEVDGELVTTPQTYSWALNSTHTLNVASGVQTLTGDIENSTTSTTFYYTYGRWNDSTEQSHTITVLPGDGGAGFPSTSPQVATYSANFVQLVPYTSSVYPLGDGTVAISPTPQSYSGQSGQFLIARQEATLTATPAAGWNFYEFNNAPFWLPGGLGANPKTFYVPDTGNPVNTTAEFSNLPVYTVDIAPETFSSNLYVYVDGQFYYTPVNFSHYYDYDGQKTPQWTAGSTHTLNLDSPESPYSSNSRYAFSSWSDGGGQSHSIASLPAIRTSFVATVAPQFAPANNLSDPPCGGSGTLTPASPTGDGFYPSGQELTYSATPTPGYSWTFAGWTYDLTGTATPANLTANDETLVNATFNIVDTPLTLTGLTPSAANAGGANFTLTLSGTGFSPDSVVGIHYGTTTDYPAVTYVSSEQLMATMTAAEIASPGALQVYVENYPQNQGWNGCAVFGYQTFIVHQSNLATSTVVSSSSNPSNYGDSITFTAAVTSSENNATGTVTFMDGASVLATEPLNSSGIASYATTALAVGTHSITAGYHGDSNNLASTSGALTQAVVGSAASLTSPSTSSPLASSQVKFTWGSESGAVDYSLRLGTTVGGYNLFASGKFTGTSVTASNLPTNGETIYARLYTYYSSSTVYNDYTFTASAGAALTSPANHATFTSSQVKFTWGSVIGATDYSIRLGTAVGGYDLYASGEFGGNSATVSNLPVNGETIYARLYTYLGSNTVYNDYTFKAATSAGTWVQTGGVE